MRMPPAERAEHFAIVDSTKNDREQHAMPDQRDNPPTEQPSPPPKKHRYTRWSIIAGLLSVPIGLRFGKALGEAMEWGKAATVLAQCAIGGILAVVFRGAVNCFFGKEVEVTARKQP
jgi:hypothetical protein